MLNSTLIAVSQDNAIYALPEQLDDITRTLYEVAYIGGEDAIMISDLELLLVAEMADGQIRCDYYSYAFDAIYKIYGKDTAECHAKAVRRENEDIDDWNTNECWK